MPCEYEGLKLGNQLCFPLYAAARKITNKYTPYLKPLGLTYTQYIVFMVLWEMDEVTVGELCRRLYLDSGTLTPLLKKMEEHGWVVRSRSHEDERVVMITLTDEGRGMMDKCRDIPSKIGSCVRITPEQAVQLHSLLHMLLEEI